MLKYLSKFLPWFLCLVLPITIAALTFLSLYLSFAREMGPKLSKDSFQADLTYRRAQVAQGGTLVAPLKPAGDSSKMIFDSSKRGRRGPLLRWLSLRPLQLARPLLQLLRMPLPD